MVVIRWVQRFSAGRFGHFSEKGGNNEIGLDGRMTGWHREKFIEVATKMGVPIDTRVQSSQPSSTSTSPI
jgi:hypothetical protein